MDHRCYICQEIIPEEIAEEQNREQQPGNYIGCTNHLEQVDILNVKLREIQRLRIDGFWDQAEKLVPEMKALKEQFGVKNEFEG
jgi:hypothetical protein